MWKKSPSYGNNFVVKTLRTFQLIKNKAAEKLEIFEDIVELGRQILDVPIVAINLVDERDTVMLAERGLSCASADRGVTPCSHTILLNKFEPFIIPDTTKDWRFKNNPIVVGPLNISFYAAFPLRINGFINDEYFVDKCKSFLKYKLLK